MRAFSPCSLGLKGLCVDVVDGSVRKRNRMALAGVGLRGLMSVELIRLMLKIRHDPRCLILWEWQCCSTQKSCRIFRSKSSKSSLGFRAVIPDKLICFLS